MNEDKLHIQNYRYLIIGGTTKAATTSVFYYLADHPQVCAAFRKETRFFLDQDYINPSLYRYEDGLEKYETFFLNTSSAKLLIEATPEYLYSSGTPYKINNSLPKAKILFILREPISRLISWYRFAMQAGIIAGNISFDEYVIQQFHNKENIKKNLRILEQGLYSNYLKSYFVVFGKDRVHVIFYENLSNNPEIVLKEICMFGDIDPEFFSNYNFEVLNRTEKMRSVKVHKAYINIRKLINIKLPRVYKSLRKIWMPLKPIYLNLNTVQTENVLISPTTKAFLSDYYGQEANSLVSLLGKPVPWQSAQLFSNKIYYE